jgi:Fe2+ transport system protein FeoA
MTKPSRIVPFPLSQASEGTTATVERITEEAEPDRKLMELSGVTVCDRAPASGFGEVAPWAGTVTTEGNGRLIVLGVAAAGKIWVYQAA